MEKQIYHICQKDDFERLYPNDIYYSKNYADEGFIHCCYRHQIDHVLSSYFKETTDLILIEIDPNKLDNLRIEGAYEDKGPFPHLYEGISERSIIKITTLSNEQ